MQLSVAFKFYYDKLVLRWFDSAASEQKAAMILFQFGQFVGISPKNICFLSLDLKKDTAFGKECKVRKLWLRKNIC